LNISYQIHKLVESEVDSALANPVWSALTTAQSTLAIQAGKLKHFAPLIAPFCAVEHDGAHLTSEELASLPADVWFLGALPSALSAPMLTELPPVAQLLHDGHVTALRAGHGLTIARMGAADNPDLLDLINLAYPGYFRSHTATLGQYVGVRHGGQLVAMAGQRMHITGYREISAVCTRPGHTGRGYARALTEWLTGAILADGELPFLHASAGNARALALYEQMGFRVTRTLRHARLNIAQITTDHSIASKHRKHHA
jgi:ribosomal protein S18 acetylase RimI-like enzyme